MNKPTRPQHLPSPIKPTPQAPPPYRPQPAPKCLQPKAATPRQPPTGRANPTPSPPPVYRPQPTPKVLQTKTTAKRQAPSPKVDHTPTTRPLQAVPKALQPKMLGRQGPSQRHGSSPPATPQRCARPPHQQRAHQLHVRVSDVRPAAGAPKATRGVAVQAKAVKFPARPGGRVIQRMMEPTTQVSSEVRGGVTYNQLWLKHDRGAKCQQVIAWKLSPLLGSKSGFIVQQVTLVFNNNLVDSYFEAWKVVGGVVEGGAEEATDQFTFGPFADNLRGSVIASAEFIETDEPGSWSTMAIERANGLRASREAPKGWRGGGLTRTFVWRTGDQGTYHLSLNGNVINDNIPVPDYYSGGVGMPGWKNQVAATKIWFERLSEGQGEEAKKQRLRTLLQESVHEGFGALAQAVDTVVSGGDATVLAFLDDLLETFKEG